MPGTVTSFDPEDVEEVDEHTLGPFAAFVGLQRLRGPFPPERIEKLPKPMWKSAWDGGRKGTCRECGGYHVLENTIHLDYVGHANATDRLLEVDPLWNWEPLAYTPEGLPLFDRSGGLWIKLTVCGVTRLGYGDGSSLKEVIGDAIRNAAMRFGVALDLWAKISLHEERNPGDGPTQQDHGSKGQSARAGGGRGSRQSGASDTAAVAPDPAPNQDALDALASACNTHGYDRRSCGLMFREWADQNDRTKLGLKDAPADDINDFTAFLIEMAEPEGAGLSDQAGRGEDAAVVEERPAGNEVAGEPVPAADEAQSGPLF